MALAGIPSLVQNFAEMGRSVDELWPKKDFQYGGPHQLNFQNFNFWSRLCHRVQYLPWCTKFHQNRTIFHWDGDWRFNYFQNGGPPSFWILKFLSRCFCVHAVLLPHTKFRRYHTIGRWVIAKKAIFKMAAPLSCFFLNFNFCGHMTIFGFNICSNVRNFINIGRFFTEIWRFKDFQNGGRPPSWILKICSFCHVAFVCMPFCFLVQNFAEIGQSVEELWPKKLRYGDLAIFKMAAVCHLGFASHYCIAGHIFVVQILSWNFMLIGFVVSQIVAISYVCLLTVYTTDHGRFGVAHALYHVTLSRGSKITTRMKFLTLICIFTMPLLCVYDDD